MEEKTCVDVGIADERVSEVNEEPVSSGGRRLSVGISGNSDEKVVDPIWPRADDTRETFDDSKLVSPGAGRLAVEISGNSEDERVVGSMWSRADDTRGTADDSRGSAVVDSSGGDSADD